MQGEDINEYQFSSPKFETLISLLNIYGLKEGRLLD